MAIVSAQILFLRLTIPADLYTSGIIVEVQGVKVRVNANLDDQYGVEKLKSSPPKRRRSEKPSKSVKADRPRNTQSHVHDPGGGSSRLSHRGGDGRAGVPEYLPTTIDLAKSFLQDEPKEEQIELQNAVAKSQYLDQSLVPSDYSDESSDLGVANTLSLPGFLADFLKGVGDRVQVKVKDVEMNLDMKLDIASESSANSDTSGRSNILTIRIHVENMIINAITRLATPNVAEQGGNIQDAANSVAREIRRITFTNFQTMLISDSSLFANVARSTGPSSPDTTHASRLIRSGSKPIGSPVSSIVAERRVECSPLLQSLDKQGSRDLEAFMINDFRQKTMKSKSSGAENESIASSGSSNPGDIPYHNSGLTGSLYATSGDISQPHRGKVNSENFPKSILYGDVANTSPLPILSPNFVDTDSGEGCRTPPGTFDALPTASPPSGNPQMGHKFDVESQASTWPSEPSAKPQDRGWAMGPNAEALSSKSASPTSSTVSPVSEDLTQSKVFSHEEAESMYMSAISHISALQTDDGTSIPGHWSASSSDSSHDGRYSPIPGDFPSMQDRTTSISRQVAATGNENGPASRRGDYSRPIHSNSHPASPGNDFPSSKPPKDVTFQPMSTAGLSSRGDGSSQASQASSANLKSPFTMMKRILMIDRIAIDFPQEKFKAIDSPIGVEHQLPAVLSETLSGSSGSNSHNSYAAAQGAPLLDRDLDPQHLCGRPSVDVGSIQILSDMGLAKLMVLVIERLAAIRSFSSSEKNQIAVRQPRPREVIQVRLKVKRICWRFLDVVKGLPETAARSQDSVEQSDLRDDSEVLLRVEVEDFGAMYHNSGPTTEMEFSIRKLSFGYVSDNILSFDSNLKMRESTRDVLAPVENDIKLTIAKTTSATKVELTTLPLHIALDSRRLDETFAWFGGFSSILGLGSSMMSTMTVVDLAAKPSPSSNRPGRGVHFESQEEQDKPRVPPPTQTQNKVTARIGGLVLDLQGTSSSLQLESTAMKLVSRTEGVGLQVDRLNISGSCPKSTSSEPSTAVKLSNLRVEYLSTPKEKDLDRLLALLSPSRNEYEKDDDILLDTLLRQRRQGSVVRATVETLEAVVSDLDGLPCFVALSEDFKKLSTVAKYLPEDDRPGILTLMLARNLRIRINVNDSFGTAVLVSKNLEAAYVGFPSLIALGITTLSLHRNDTEELVGHALPMQIVEEAYSPMVMARFIGNEMEPTAKLKLYHVRVEYHVPTLMAVMGMEENTSVESLLTDIVSSVATLTTQPNYREYKPKHPSKDPTSGDRSRDPKEIRLDIAVRDSTIGLNPRNSPAKGLFVLTDLHFVGAMPRDEEANAVLDIRKASLMVIDDRDSVFSTAQSSKNQRSLVESLSEIGYVSVSLISAAKATINVVRLDNDLSKTIDVEIRDDLFVLESCADSTQTLQSIIAGLTPPTPPCTEPKYRTEVIPVQDMLASFEGDAYPATQFSHDTDEELLDDGDMVDDEVPQNLEFVSSFYNPDPKSVYEGIANSMLEDDIESLPSSSIIREIGSRNRLESFQEQTQIAPENDPLEFRDDHFGESSVRGGTAHSRNTEPKTYALSKGFDLRDSPLRIRVRDVHFIWNLYDGYDWQSTRDTISKAIEDVQSKATERWARNDKRKSADPEDEEESVIGDFLFNSIYIGVPANRDPRELAHQINRNLDDLVSETESYATSTSSGSPSRKGQAPRPRGGRKLRLKRSKYHKMTFELKGVSADMVVFPPDSGDTQSSLDIRVRDLEIFDHVPTSTWKKFATYMQDDGERESGTDMIHLEILNVKPVPSLAASEIILKVRKKIWHNAKANS